MSTDCDPRAIQMDEIAKSLKAIRHQMDCATYRIKNPQMNPICGHFQNIEHQLRRIELVAGLTVTEHEGEWT